MPAADVLRPPASPFQAALMSRVMASVPFVFRLLRTIWPIPRMGKIVLVTRYDDVREVFLNDPAFRVPYGPKLDVIMGNHPFFLGMDDTADYRRDTAAMRMVMRPDDITRRLVPAVEKLAGEIVEAGAGTLEVVDGLVRRTTFEVFSDYFGVSAPPGEDLRLWATRLFEFQFADPGNDAVLRTEVDRIAPALRDRIQSLIEARRASGVRQDDVLGRCIELQARNTDGFDDGHIRSALMGLIVGGPPQPPMVVPQALEQLLRRPAALAGAQEAARRDDDELLGRYVFEALRFDPLAPVLPRVAVGPTKIAAGTPRQVTVAEGSTVFVGFSSAMMDGRRLADPRSFNPNRLAHEYFHFGYGLHTCFGIHINRRILPLMLKPLLKKNGLRRAPGADGKLRKRGAFADRLVVNYDR
jgi:cytochrome P450